MTCHLEDPGYPEAEEFIWLKFTDIIIFGLPFLLDRDGEDVEETSANLFIRSLGLEEEGSYSCAGVNYLGIGDFATIDLDVIGEIILSLMILVPFLFQHYQTFFPD